MYDRQQVIDAFLKDVEAYCTNFLTIDMVIISGDLVDAASEPDVYFHLYDNFISPLSKVTRCDERRIFLCPGNHDVQQDIVKERHVEQTALLEDLNNSNSLNAAYQNGSISEFASSRFSHFLEFSEFCANLSPTYVDNIVSVQSERSLAVDVICLNTAWSSWAGLTQFGSDEKNLLMPAHALHRAMDHCHDDHLKLLVTHHPTSWLSSFCERDLLAVLRNFDKRLFFHFFGHMHEVQPQQLSSLHGRWLSAQSGALYSARDRYNGYSVICLDLEDPHPVISYRSYFDASRSFAEAVDLAPNTNGLFFPTSKARKYWHALRQRVDQTMLAAWISQDLYAHAEQEFNEGLLDRPVGQLFVPPPLYLNFHIDEGTDEDTPERQEEPITLSEVVTSNSNYILYGRQEFGKTTLLQQLALRLMKTVASGTSTVAIPIVIDFKDIKPGKDRIVRLLKAALQIDLPEGMSLSVCLHEGLVSVLVDDVVFSDPDTMPILQQFVREYSKNRFFFTTTTHTRDTQTSVFGSELVASAGVPVAFEHVFIEAFTRRKMRVLVKKWNSTTAFDEETLLNRLIREMAGMQIPYTAVNGGILLAIYEAEAGFTPINRAILIDRFVEHLLQKRSYREAVRGVFDFTNKVHILSHLAGYMARRDRYIVDEAELLSVFQSYLNLKGLPQGHAAILRHFVEARILRRRPDNVYSFRYRAFLEYFIASQMKIEEEFRAWTLQEHNYLRFCNEIECYSGLQRNVGETLELISDRFDMLTESLSEEMGWYPDLHLLDTFKPPTSKEDLFADIEEQLATPALSAEERDELLEYELPTDAEDRQEVYRPAMEDIGQRWTACLLLYSGLVKNLDLVSDEQKRTHLRKVLKGWARFTLQALVIVPNLAAKRKLIINGVLYEVRMPRQFSNGQVARVIYTELPMTLAKLVMTHLGSEKLERQLLEKADGDDEEPLIVEFYRQTLVADLRLMKWSSHLPEFVGMLESSRYLTRSFLRKMSDIYLVGGLEKAVTLRLQSEIGDVVSRLKGGSAKERTEIKGRAIQRIEKRARIRQLQITTNNQEET